MIVKSVVMHDIPMDRIAAMERWYFREHAAEIAWRYRPWMEKHDSYMPVDAPQEARVLGHYNWRVTECFWREIPLAGPRGHFAFTVPPVWPLVATSFFPAQPTHDFMGGSIQPHEKQALRWYVLFKFPDGVSKEDGDAWFLDVHAKELMKQPGLYRLFATKAVREHFPLPGEWPDGKRPPMDTIHHSFDWLIELWYETFADWRKGVLTDPPSYTKPAWATSAQYPFVPLRSHFASSFLLERPCDEFYRDSRGYL